MERSWTKQTDRALLVRFFFGRDFDMQSQWTIKFAACTHRYEYIRHSINRKTNKEKHLKSETKMAKIKTEMKASFRDGREGLVKTKYFNSVFFQINFFLIYFFILEKWFFYGFYGYFFILLNICGFCCFFLLLALCYFLLLLFYLGF